MNISRLLLLPDVVERVRLSRPTIFRLRRAGIFPEPVLLGARRLAWRGEDVERYLASLAPAPAPKATAP
jgi:prophage regulatory protein